MAQPKIEDIIQSEFLQNYLAYVQSTEPPRIMHIWAALTAAGAAMARHVYWPFALGNIYPNMYTFLVGPPGTRKSTAMNLAKSLLRETTVRFAPDDTAGQRQGLITALIGKTEGNGIDKDELAEIAAADISTMLVKAGELQMSFNAADTHALFACASELGSLLGQCNLDLTRFLNRVWDGEPYDYQIKNVRQVIEDGLLAIVGCTTPSDLAKIMPQDAIGQGFMSRCIFVFAAKKFRSIPPSQTRLNTAMEQPLRETMSWLSHELQGEMTVAARASKRLDDMYMVERQISDTRFVYYAERRHTHLMKLAMVIAATRRSREITIHDIEEAEAILSWTEVHMSDALGEYGLSPLSKAKQEIVEFLRHVGEPVKENQLRIMMARDMKLIDFRNAMMDLVNTGKVEQVTIDHQPGYIVMDMGDGLRELAAELDQKQLDS